MYFITLVLQMRISQESQWPQANKLPNHSPNQTTGRLSPQPGPSPCPLFLNALFTYGILQAQLHINTSENDKNKSVPFSYLLEFQMLSAFYEFHENWTWSLSNAPSLPLLLPLSRKSPKAHVLKAWSSAWCYWNDGNFKSWALQKTLGKSFESCHQSG
jgi:hypothetical protein